MSTTNPYLYTDLGATWQQGYDTALSTPNEIPSAPYVVAPELVDTCAEGAAAGNWDGQAEGWRVRLEFDGSGFQPEHAHYAGAGVHAAEIIYDTVRHRLAGGIGSLPLLLMLAIDLETIPPTEEQVIALAGKALTDACARLGFNEVFMAACGEADHGESGDPMLDAGYWHGSVHSFYTSAGSECSDHAQGYGHDAGAIPYQANSSNLWEWIDPA